MDCGAALAAPPQTLSSELSTCFCSKVYVSYSTVVVQEKFYSACPARIEYRSCTAHAHGVGHGQPPSENGDQGGRCRDPEPAKPVTLPALLTPVDNQQLTDTQVRHCSARDLRCTRPQRRPLV
jgi:hypothetical protein